MLSATSSTGPKGLIERFLFYPIFTFRGEGSLIGPRDPESFVREPEPPLMPQTFEEFVGQHEAKTILSIEAATVRRTGRAFGHVLAYGPPGVGKTSLAWVCAASVGAVVYTSSGAEYPDQRSLLLAFSAVGELYSQTGKAIHWHIDELDAVPRVASYVLHSLLQNNYVTFEGEKYGAVPVTIFATTNHVARLSAPLRDRFPIQVKLDLYAPEELALLAEGAARKRGLQLSQEASALIGLNGAGNPRQVTTRILPALLNTMEDDTFVTVEDARRALQVAGIREGGLQADQVSILELLDRVGTASLATIGAVISEPTETVEDLCRWLIRSGAITVSSRGRSITSIGREYVKTLGGDVAQ